MNNNPFNNSNRDDDNNIELPKTNPDIAKKTSEENNQNLISDNQSSKPIIEIPQEYYDKLAEEENAKRQAELQKEAIRQESAALSNSLSKLLFLSVLNAIIIFGSLYLTVNKTIYAFLAIPIFIIILSIISSLKNKKDSQYSSSIMVGGITVAIVTFIISMTKEQEADLWNYYAIASGVIGFVGLIISSIINKIVVSPKEITGLQGLGYIIFFVALIGGPIYLSLHYREEFYRLFFHTQVEVVAETENDYIIKTLKARYNTDFTCDEKTVKNEFDDSTKRKQTHRTCQDKNNNKIVVLSITYNEGDKQYIVRDNYLDVLFLNSHKTLIAENIKTNIGASGVDIYLYPKENCLFYGDCKDCDNYWEEHSKIYNVDNQYKASTKHNFSNFLTQDAKTFINSNEFTYIIDIKGTFNFNADYNLIIDNVLSKLNQLGYQNNYGFVISLYNSDSSLSGFETSSLVYKVKGDSTSDKTFKDPVTIDISTKH